MKKGLKFLTIIFTLMMGILLIGNLSFVHVSADEATSSEYVKTINDLKKTKLLGGANLYEQQWSSLKNGQADEEWHPHYVQWVDLDNYNNGLKLVTWTKQSADSWSAATTRKCAEDWEKAHPGWIVVAGTNGDFFQNSGVITWEPTNNFMADGDMYRADLATASYRNVIGITDDNEVVVGRPEITGLYLQLMTEDGKVSEEFPMATYNKAPKEDGLNLYTKDISSTFNLTGYTVYVGEYTICRISNGSNATVFVKGAIVSKHDGTDKEMPMATRMVQGEGGKYETIETREFYIATKDASFEEKLTEGTLVRCQHKYGGDFAEVTQSMGYIYQMLVDGESQFKADHTSDFIYTDHPRTFIGFKADGTPVLMVVDGRAKDNSYYGATLFEAAEFMKLAGCVNAFNLDGGGSSTLIARDYNGELQVINRPSDGPERSTGNAIFLVMPASNLVCNDDLSTETTVTINKEDNDASKKMTDIKVGINGKTYDMTSDSLTISGLDENTTYNASVTYKIDGKEVKSSVLVKTKEYVPDITIKSRTRGFLFIKEDNNDILKVQNIVIKINGETYEMKDEDWFEIKGLVKDQAYEIEYQYDILNTSNNTTKTKTVAKREYRTLDFELPEIKLFDVTTNKDKLKVEYEYQDSSKIVTEAYLLINGEKHPLSYSSDLVTIDSLDFENNLYEVQIIIKFLVSGEENEARSDVITVGTAPCEHDWEEATYDHPKRCKKCGITEGEPLERPVDNNDKKGCNSCKKDAVFSMILLSTILSASIIIFRKKR